MSFILATMLASAPVLPFIDRAELHAAATSEAQDKTVSGPKLASSARNGRPMATLCSMAGKLPDRVGVFSDGSKVFVLSPAVMALLKSACTQRAAVAPLASVSFAAR